MSDDPSGRERLRGWEDEPASDDLMSPRVLERVREELHEREPEPEPEPEEPDS